MGTGASPVVRWRSALRRLRNFVSDSQFRLPFVCERRKTERFRVGAAGFEPPEICKNTEQSGTSELADSAAAGGSNDAKCATIGALNNSANEEIDLEATLARAIEAATTASRFDVVAQLCRELEARRLARAGNVVQLDSKRGSRG